MAPKKKQRQLVFVPEQKQQQAHEEHAAALHERGTSRGLLCLGAHRCGSGGIRESGLL